MSTNDAEGHCVHCGRDNRGYESEPCCEDCPGEQASAGAFVPTPRQKRELYKDYWEADNIGYEVLADPSIAEKVLQAPITSDDVSEGRSAWVWIRLATGALVLACYPKGDTYCETEADLERP